MSFVLDLTRGQARVRQVVFNRGQPRPTVSIGRAAAWSLVADELEDVHAFVSFDGAALMVRSAEEHNPAWLDGRAVPCAWTPVGRASILALGNARITVTAKEDHVRPGHDDDDDEVTGQIDLKAKGAVPNTAPTGVTAVTAPPPMTDPDGVDAEQGVTGDEPTGEMNGEITGARAPARGLLPKPRVPPRPSASLVAAAPLSVDPPTEPPVRPLAPPAAAPAGAPPPMDVPDFDDPTQLRPREGLVAPAAGRPAPPRAALPMVSRAADVDDEERTHALDVQAMQAAQRGSGAPVPRPARPNIAIAPDTDEATRMLSVAPAGRATVQLGAMPTPPPPPPRPAASHRSTSNAPTDPPPPPFTAAAAAAPMYPAPTPLTGGVGGVGGADEAEEAPPPSGQTRLRPMTAQPMRPPNQLVPVRPRAETLIDPFAKTGGGPVALRNLPPIPPANPGTADITGKARVDSAPAAAPKKKRSPVASWIAAGVVLTALGGEIYYVYFFHPKAVTNVPQVPTLAPTAPGQALTSVPTVAASDPDAAAGFTVPQNRSVMPLPELPHKGPVDAGAPLDASALDAGLLTIQRAASDAVADGDYARAVLYYDRLTELDPKTAAYSAAARILRAQMAADAGARRF
jgi:hypothetical protein